MKQCPKCNRRYDDDSLRFCLEDGAALIELSDSAPTLIIPPARITQAPTEVLPSPSSIVAQHQPAQRRAPWTHFVIIALLALIAGGGVVWLLRSGNNANPNAGPVNGTRETVGKPSSTEPASTPASTTPDRGKPSAPAQPAATPIVTEPNPQPASGTWFVILGSFTKNRRDAAEQKLQTVRSAGYQVSIIDTDDYPALSPGYWAVAAGPMAQSAAKTLRGQMLSAFPDAYAKSGF